MLNVGEWRINVDDLSEVCVGKALAGVLDVFFFQAEDGIRDVAVTGVQTCALPILLGQVNLAEASPLRHHRVPRIRARLAARRTSTKQVRPNQIPPRPRPAAPASKIGRASCRERV